jgi:hypothetical protein
MPHLDHKKLSSKLDDVSSDDPNIGFLGEGLGGKITGGCGMEVSLEGY